jgi:DNA polymerase III epsilon subunit-like protein
MITYIGLDGEMSSSDIHAGAKLIQIGLAKFVGEEIESVGILLNPGKEMHWTAEAQSVHQFTREDLWSKGLMPDSVDSDLANWANPGRMRRDTVAVGFNVGAFDMPFVEQSLPFLRSKLSRRSVDLNSIIFAMADTDRQVQKIKAAAKDYARQKMEGMFSGFKNREHDAEYDAVMALYCFEYLRSVIKK